MKNKVKWIETYSDNLVEIICEEFINTIGIEDLIEEVKITEILDEYIKSYKFNHQLTIKYKDAGELTIKPIEVYDEYLFELRIRKIIKHEGVWMTATMTESIPAVSHISVKDMDISDNICIDRKKKHLYSTAYMDKKYLVPDTSLIDSKCWYFVLLVFAGEFFSNVGWMTKSSTIIFLLGIPTIIRLLLIYRYHNRDNQYLFEIPTLVTLIIFILTSLVIIF